MTLAALVLTSLAASLALIGLGGGLYETRVLDPAWPGRIDLIQPQHGGVTRRRFWIPMHLAFEFSLIAALILSWPQRPVRLCLLLALASHAAMRIWSAFSFHSPGGRLRAGPARPGHRGGGPALDASEPPPAAARLPDLRHRAGRLRPHGAPVVTGPEPEAPDESVRRLGAQSVMISQAVASRVGLHTTDLECLDLILLREETTPGELAKATGLTTGAVTALIDRLEQRGYVDRIPDPRDRRRVLLRVRPESIAAIQAVYRPMQARIASRESPGCRPPCHGGTQPEAKPRAGSRDMRRHAAGRNPPLFLRD